jgi:tRNA-splicing ligase RtcB (3'-phosphate/5'-hydroxy nucleic acid ligase)
VAPDLSNSIDSALGGDRRALVALARRHLGWTRREVALVGRGDPEAVARAEAAVARLRAGRSGATVEPVVVGLHDERTVDQLRRCLDHDDAVAGALCADGHLGYSQPVGGAVAYREHVSVSGVGYDIACGNLAVRAALPFGAVEDRVGPLLDAVADRVSFGVGRKNARRVEHALFDDEEAWRAADALHLREMARGQLGTVGAGNHYVDLFREVAEGMAEAESPVWIGVHFGSRGLGHKLATQYLKRGGRRDGIDERPTLLHQDSDLGRAYLAAMALAGRYAYAGREWVAAQALDILGAEKTLEVHNHHNFAWREEVGGAPAWVVRKGCTPAFPGQAGFVGGSMGDDAVVLEGAEDAAAAGLLRSTVHGAGRVMGRRQALRTLAREDMEAWLRRRGVQLRGGDLDESPMAYRRLDEVLAHHAGTVRVLHRLRPFGVVMAGPGEFDPYKD